MQKIITVILCAAIFCSACASAGGGTRIASTPPARQVDTALFASYVSHLAIGSRVRVALTDGHTVKGTLMKVDGDAIIVQPRTRIPEPPLRIALDRIVTVELESSAGVGKTIAIGVVSGVGGVLAVFLILAAIYAGD